MNLKSLIDAQEFWDDILIYENQLQKFLLKDIQMPKEIRDLYLAKKLFEENLKKIYINGLVYLLAQNKEGIFMNLIKNDVAKINDLNQIIYKQFKTTDFKMIESNSSKIKMSPFIQYLVQNMVFFEEIKQLFENDLILTKIKQKKISFRESNLFPSTCEQRFKIHSFPKHISKYHFLCENVFDIEAFCELQSFYGLRGQNTKNQKIQ